MGRQSWFMNYLQAEHRPGAAPTEQPAQDFAKDLVHQPA
jgi:hypothetical protein